MSATDSVLATFSGLLQLPPTAPTRTAAGHAALKATDPMDAWRQRLTPLDHAFQPIVDLRTGACVGVEALLRNLDATALRSPQELFDRLHHSGVLLDATCVLWEKAVAKFVQIPFAPSLRLFYNLDHRLLSRLPEFGAACEAAARECGHPPAMIALEISEQTNLAAKDMPRPAFRDIKTRGIRLAVDDYGIGHGNLLTLYTADPEFLKIDRFFISGIPTDARKRLFVAKTVNLAHTLGISVVAEGVETEMELKVCRELGCDLAQGFWIQRPMTDIDLLQSVYADVRLAAEAQHDRRESGAPPLRDAIENLVPLTVERLTIDGLFDFFRQNPQLSYVPAVNACREPLGLIRERDLKEYAFSKFGRDLLRNPFSGLSLPHFVTPCARADAACSLEQLLETVSAEDSSEGVLLTDQGRYLGFLSAQALLKLLYQRDLEQAHELNPLTKLPGNNRITQYIDSARADTVTGYVLAYFDLDHFKPFNDRYGFRRGDRVIQLMADILKRAAMPARFFAAHIGGDDFFAGLHTQAHHDVAAACVLLYETAARFHADVASLYDEADRMRGHVRAVGRDGVMRDYPLLTVSTAILVLPPGRPLLTSDEVAHHLAEVKKQAKADPYHVALLRLDLPQLPMDATG